MIFLRPQLVLCSHSSKYLGLIQKVLLLQSIYPCVCQFGDGNMDFDSIINAMLSATPQPTAAPTLSPTHTPTASPTFHSCDDGSHGCEHLCFEDEVSARITGIGWKCACRDGYVIKTGSKTACVLTVAPTVAPTPVAPNLNDLLNQVNKHTDVLHYSF